MFKLGFQCGYSPDEILDWNLDTFHAMVEGYTERQFALGVIAVQIGYWSGYYNSSGNKKSVEEIVQKMERARSGKSTVPGVDVEEFLRREREFGRRMMRGEVSVDKSAD